MEPKKVEDIEEDQGKRQWLHRENNSKKVVVV